jgi:hypothetical protein
MEKPNWFKIGTLVMVVNPDKINRNMNKTKPIGTIFKIEMLGGNQTGPLCWGKKIKNYRGTGFYSTEVAPATKIVVRFYGRKLNENRFKGF